MERSTILVCFFSTFLLLCEIYGSEFYTYTVSQVSATPESKGVKHGHCSVLSTEQLTEYGSTHSYANGVPKIIHYVFRGSYIPAQYSPHVQQCMQINNDSKFVFWSDFSAYRFMAKKYQSYLSIYNSNFDKNTETLKVSDVIRYFLLLEFGGVYMDLDTKCQKPFASAFTNESCILSRDVEEQTQILFNTDFLAMNSFMACVAGHDFFRYLVDRLTMADSTWVLEQTGPIFLTDVFIEYTGNVSNQAGWNRTKSIIVADAYTYSPHTEPFLENKCNRTLTGEWMKKGCKNLAMHRSLQKIKYGEAVVVHLFMHLGYRWKYKQIKHLEHVCLRFANVTYVWM